jgi:hypothetical protein
MSATAETAPHCTTVRRTPIASGDAHPYRYEFLESGIHTNDVADEAARPHKPRGFYLLPESSPGDVFFDMEGDPYYDIGTGLEYLFGARVDELVQLKRQQLVADIDGHGGYVTLYGKHGGRTIRVGRRTWDALQFLADGKEPDERIIAITDERIRQILTAAAAAHRQRRSRYASNC